MKYDKCHEDANEERKKLEDSIQLIKERLLDQDSHISLNDLKIRKEVNKLSVLQE
jgi:hypothetical protein